LHEIEFNFLNGNLMVPLAQEPIFPVQPGAAHLNKGADQCKRGEEL
jgi:hypothetical protein